MNPQTLCSFPHTLSIRWMYYPAITTIPKDVSNGASQNYSEVIRIVEPALEFKDILI
jgi:hypothetical protein